MPAPGDQHRENAATANPFIPPNTHVTEYTAREIATLQSRLDKQLGPEYISTRPGNGGGKVHYLAAEKAINLANEVFGFNGWSSAIQNVQIDFVDENPQSGRINLGLSATVRVTLKDGTYHEDIGYGHCENTKGKAAAFEKAKKEAATDALKRALRTFGNVLGNCLYDKDYLQRITRVKVAPSRWDVENLHRHPDYAPIKKENVVNDAPGPAHPPTSKRNSSARSAESFASTEFEDDFGGNFLDETDFSHPDEVRLDDSTSNVRESAVQTAISGQRQGLPRIHSMPQLANTGGHAPSLRVPAANQPQSIAGQHSTRMQPPRTPGKQHRPHAVDQTESQTLSDIPGPAAGQTESARQGQTGAPGNDQLDGSSAAFPRQPPPGAPEGFVTGRKADLLSQPPEKRPPNASLAFNPHLESPSIRRTHGINPGKSVPISRQQLAGHGGNPSASQAQHSAPPHQDTVAPTNAVGSTLSSSPRPPVANFVNPSADPNRRIGMPQSTGHTGVPNRGVYRPPTAVKRPALADVSNMQQPDIPSDTKKAKVDHVANGQDGQSNASAVT